MWGFICGLMHRRPVSNTRKWKGEIKSASPPSTPRGLDINRQTPSSSDRWRPQPAPGYGSEITALKSERAPVLVPCPKIFWGESAGGKRHFSHLPTVRKRLCFGMCVFGNGTRLPATVCWVPSRCPIEVPERAALARGRTGGRSLLPRDCANRGQLCSDPLRSIGCADEMLRVLSGMPKAHGDETWALSWWLSLPTIPAEPLLTAVASRLTGDVHPPAWRRRFCWAGHCVRDFPLE